LTSLLIGSCRHIFVLLARSALAVLAAVAISDPTVRAADDFEREPINYSASQPANAVTELQKRLWSEKIRLDFDDRWGYLRSVLRALDIPESSQMLVFSKTSFQRQRIAPRTPRALYFNDDVYVGYCFDGDVMEISAADSKLGAVFYTLDQERADRPAIKRQGDSCLICHASSQTQGVPGFVARSVYCDSSGFPILASGTFRTDQSSPLENRWGGWYVTGTHGKQKHLGNLIVTDKRAPEETDNSAGMNVTNLEGRFDHSKYLSGASDIVALMVLAHQTAAHNLITAANFQTRLALAQEAALNRELKKPPGYRWESTTSRIKSVGEPLVKYLLFSKESKLTEPLKGTTSFAREFAARGPRDKQGRSLREFDLKTRLFKYPCSYLIYSPSFDALPAEVRDYVYKRMWQVLSGTDTSVDFAHLTLERRRAIVRILTQTKQGLPAYWKPLETAGE